MNITSITSPNVPDHSHSKTAQHWSSLFSLPQIFWHTFSRKEIITLLAAVSTKVFYRDCLGSLSANKERPSFTRQNLWGSYFPGFTNWSHNTASWLELTDWLVAGPVFGHAPKWHCSRNSIGLGFECWRLSVFSCVAPSGTRLVSLRLVAGTDRCPGHKRYLQTTGLVSSDTWRTLVITLLKRNETRWSFLCLSLV